MDWSALIGAGAGAAVLIIGKAVEWQMARSKTQADLEKERSQQNLETKKAESEITLAANQQALATYKEIITSMRTDMDKMMEFAHAQDKDYLDCREERAKLRVQVDNLESRVRDMEGRVATMTK